MNLITQGICQTDDIRLIPLSRGLFAIVDAADCEFIARWQWHICYDLGMKHLYAVRRIHINGHTTAIWMHREILGLKPNNGLYVDHINGYGLDNRRQNLRCVTNQQNQWNRKISNTNTSGFKGVTYVPSRKSPWNARIRIDGKQRSLGYFFSKEAAYQAYCDAAKTFHGEFFYLK